jgi:hypothetical protein
MRVIVNNNFLIMFLFLILYKIFLDSLNIRNKYTNLFCNIFFIFMVYSFYILINYILFQFINIIIVNESNHIILQKGIKFVIDKIILHKVLHKSGLNYLFHFFLEFYCFYIIDCGIIYIWNKMICRFILLILFLSFCLLIFFIYLNYGI